MIFRIFNLRTDLNNIDEFNNLGKINIESAIKLESGTKTLLSAHDTNDVTDNFVLEIYEDNDSYIKHANSEYFKKFAEFSKNSNIDRHEIFELDPELLTEKKAPIQELYNAQTSVRLAKIKIDTANADIFKNIVFEEMKTAVEVESGVFLMYAGSLKDDPSKWIFFEIYQDNEAYLEHLETDHFKKYISGTKNIVLEKQLYELKPDTLANKGGLFYQSK